LLFTIPIIKVDGLKVEDDSEGSIFID